MLACPRCPLCDQPPAFVLVGDTQAWCGTEGCEVWTWNPSRTLDENLVDVGPVKWGRDS